MERDDRTPVALVATFVVGQPVAEREGIALGGDAAHHARVKRLELGDSVRLTNGAGTRAIAEITELSRTALGVIVQSIDHVPRPSPIHLRAPVADRDRMLWLAEKATELGVASWQAVRFRRSMSVSPRGEGGAFAEKVRVRMRSALEQSGGAWLPAILPDASVESLTLAERELGILLDAAGEPLASVAHTSGDREPVVLVGPEGGLESAEREALVRAGWCPACLARTTLRFETAGIAAIAALRASRL